ncbi:MAG: HAMP domain-containing histidine kinase, partial [Gemmatimonadetes bacterium]|nr:HAMP domain-containing histidine kinase [Gemmatimonadota bacterium]
MKVRDRLVLSYALVGVMLAVPSFFAAGRLGELRDLAVRERARHAEAALALGSIETGLSEFDRFVRSYVAAPDSALRQSVFSSLSNLRENAQRIEDAGFGDATEGFDSDLGSLEAEVRELDLLVSDGRLGEATQAFFVLEPEINRAREGLEAIARNIDVRAAADFDRAEEISGSARVITLLTVLVGIILALLVTGWVHLALWAPLHRLRDAFSAVEGGRYATPRDLPYGGGDEIGDLSRSFRAMAQRLEDLDRLKTEFVGVASHELKTPINVIRGYTELIEEELAGELTQNQRDILDRIADQTRSMARMVSRLMDISKLETGSYQMEFEVVLVEDLLLGLVRGYELLAGERGINLHTEILPDTPADVEVDVDLFRGEVLGNLISNALRFAPEGGEVRVQARPDVGGVLFEVADNGPGISRRHRAHVFKKYYQAERSQAMGSGLGLAIARELVEAHGGWINLGDGNQMGLG